MDDENVNKMRHSAAHVLASAVKKIWPNTKFGVGPVVENGFYYDIDIGTATVSEDDFERIESEMQSIIDSNQRFIRKEMPIDEAISWAKHAKQPYKEELLNDLKREGTTIAKELDSSMIGVSTPDGSENPAVKNVSFYENGEFIDLCRGPHVESTGQIGRFKLLRIAGAYWRGDENKAQMQRIYGVAFQSQAELDEHLKMLEEAKKRDHRKIGQEMDLFTFSNLVGPGLPLWTPRGTIMRIEIDNFIQELREEFEYQPVSIPHITKKELYEKSGHWDKFSEELFKINSRDGHEFAMKPMNCPHHIQIYSSKQRSYKELPVRYRETTMVYRDEQTGELGGLSRVRSITQDDAHVFVRNSQIKEEVQKIWQMIDRYYSTLGMTFKVRLSLHDPAKAEAYLGEEEVWKSVESQLKDVIADNTSEYQESLGEAAFYGPKIDFMAKDAIGREHQVATIQLDFNMPENFDLTCVNEENNRERIVMIHCAIAGSLERALAVLIEHYNGRFPVWLSPEQLRIITLNQDKNIVDYANNLQKSAKKLGLRATVDSSAESVGRKIREAESFKVPYSVVIGAKELEDDSVKPRIRRDLGEATKSDALKIDDFLKSVSNEAKNRVDKTTF